MALHTHTHNTLTKRLIRYLYNKIQNLRKQNNLKVILFSVSISFLFVFSITYSATTINDNINTGGNLTVSGANTLTGAVWASSTLQTTGATRFYSTVRIDGATILNNVSYTWPSSDGSASTYLQTNGAGTLSWATVSSGANSDWLKQTNFGVLNLTASTTIPYWAKDAIYASSTLQVQGLTTLANASTTRISLTDNLMINGFATTTGSTGNIETQGTLTARGTGTSTYSGGLQSTALNITSATASSTFANGIILSRGCILSPEGTCVGGGGGSGTTGQFPYYAGSGTTLTATSSVFLASSQNLGIGTTTPNWLLQVAGTRPFFTLSDTGAAANNKHWFLSSQGGNFYVGTSSDAYATSTISALTILANSRVGIGTSTPFEKLAVQGGLGADYLTITGASNSTSTFSTGGLTVGTSQFVVQQTSGNVGVGTAGPGYKLDIGGLGSALGFSPGDTGGQGTNAVLNSIVAKNNYGVVDSTSAAAIKFLTGNDYWYKGQIAFYTNDIDSTIGAALERMRIQQNGNVGIGTTSPYAKLSVVGETVSTYFTATSTTATSTFLGAVGVGTSTPTEQLSVSGRLYIGGTGTSTIQNNLYVMGTLRSTVSYVGDLIFSNNFKFIETSPNAKVQSLFLQNQYGENIFKIDEKGQVVIKEIQVKIIEVEKGKFKEGNFEEKLQIGSPQNRTGITIYDKKTGEPVCVFSENNVLKSSKGECK